MQEAGSGLHFPCRRNCWAAFLLLAATALAYGYTLGYPLQWDDTLLITDNPQLHSWKYFGQFFIQDLFRGHGPGVFYRPTQSILNLINYQIAGTAPWIYHLTNLLLHALTAWLLFILFRSISGEFIAPLLAALLWAVHPLQVETITYVATRSDPTAAIFWLGALLLHRRAGKISEPGARRGLRLAAALFFAAAMWSKENAFVMIPLALFLDCREYGRPSLRRAGGSLWPYLAVLAGYTLARAAVLPALFGQANHPHPHWALATFPALIEGLRLVFIPYPLYFDRLAPALGKGGLAWSLIALLLVAAAAYLIWRGRRRYPTLAQSSAFFALASLPLPLLLRRDQILLDHFFYLSSFGACLAAVSLIGSALERLNGPVKMRLAGGLFAAAFISLLALTYRQNLLWSDLVSLHRRVVQYRPDHYRAWANLAQGYFLTGRWAEAEQAFRRARALNDLPGIESALGNCLLRQNRLGEARRHYDLALTRFPHSLLLLNERAYTLFQLGEKEAALRDLLTARQLEPRFSRTWNNLAVVYADLGQADKAAAAAKKAAETEALFSDLPLE